MNGSTKKYASLYHGSSHITTGKDPVKRTDNVIPSYSQTKGYNLPGLLDKDTYDDLLESSKWTSGTGDYIDDIYYIAGNVGIGTTTPAEKFEVHGTSGQLFQISDDLDDVVFSANNISGLPVIEAKADNTVILGKFGRNDLVIESTGEVGIGTAAPNSPLHIKKVDLVNDSRNNLLIIDGKFAPASINMDDEIGIAFRLENNNITPGSQQTTSITSSYNSSGNNNLNLQPGGGYVGIGTNDPGAELDIIGDLKFSGDFNDVLGEAPASSTDPDKRYNIQKIVTYGGGVTWETQEVGQSEGDHTHTFGIADNNAVEIDHANTGSDPIVAGVVTGDYARFTANGLQGETPAEVLANIGAQTQGSYQNALTFGIADTNAVKMDGTGADNSYARFTASGLEARTTAQVLGDIGAQASDVDLTAIAGLAITDGNFIVGNGTTWVVESAGTARESLGLTAGSSIDWSNSSTTDSFYSGAATLSSTLGVVGLSNLDGGIEVFDSTNENVFTVATSTGDTVIKGTLGVAGAVVMGGGTTTVNIGTAGTISATSYIMGDHWSGDFSVKTTGSSPVQKFVVVGASGNTTISGTLGVVGLTNLDGGIEVNDSTNGDVFTVDGITGNTIIKGTLSVSEQLTFERLNISTDDGTAYPAASFENTYIDVVNDTRVEISQPNTTTVGVTGLHVGSKYTIAKLGDINWNTVANTSNVTYGIGVTFTAAASGDSGWTSGEDAGEVWYFPTEYQSKIAASFMYGNVGIGTPTPIESLTIEDGNIFFTSSKVTGQAEDQRIRFTERRSIRNEDPLSNDTGIQGSPGFVGAYIHYDASNNKFKLGVNNIDVSQRDYTYDISDDVDAIVIERSSGDVNITKNLTTDGNILALGGITTTGDLTLKETGASPKKVTFSLDDITVDRILTVPDNTGTLALIEDIPGEGIDWSSSNTTEFYSGIANVVGDLNVSSGDLVISGSVKYSDTSKFWLSTATDWGLYWNTIPNELEFRGGEAVAISTVELGRSYVIVNIGNLPQTSAESWNTLAGTTSQTYVAGDYFTAAVAGFSSSTSATVNPIKGHIDLDDGSMGFLGLANLDGGIEVYSGTSNVFTVSGSTGDTITTGTLTAGGLSYLNGGINVNASKFIVSSAGVLTVTGFSNLDGGFDVDGGKFDVQPDGTLGTAAGATFAGDVGTTGAFAAGDGDFSVSSAGKVTAGEWNGDEIASSYIGSHDHSGYADSQVYLTNIQQLGSSFGFVTNYDVTEQAHDATGATLAATITGYGIKHATGISVSSAISTLAQSLIDQAAVLVSMGTLVTTLAGYHSDMRYKENVLNITENYLDKVDDLDVFNYDWNSKIKLNTGGGLNPKGNLGISAQQLEQISPSLVQERSVKGSFPVKTINPSSGFAFLVKLIQELKEKNDSLEQRVDGLTENLNLEN